MRETRKRGGFGTRIRQFIAVYIIVSFDPGKVIGKPKFPGGAEEAFYDRDVPI
jgi:hypothetical protein